MKRIKQKKAIKKKDKINITFPYKQKTVNLIRTLPNRDYIQKNKKTYWICDITIEAIQNLIDWNFAIDDKLMSLFNKKQLVKSLKIKIKKTLFLTNIPSVLKNELKDKLTLTNPKYTNAHKMGRWSKHIPKKLYFYTEVGNNLSVPRGLLKYVIKSCKNKNIGFIIDDKRKDKKKIDFKFNGKLKPIQVKAIKNIMQHDFNVLCAPTGSGKTVMALYTIIKRKQPTLIIVHTKELAKQWMSRISTFLNIDKNQIGLIGDGQFEIGEKITVALIQTLYKCVDIVAKEIGYLIIDECHRCPSRIFTEAVTNFDCKYMLGLSATPYRSDGLTELIFSYVGDMNHEIKKIDMINEGLIPETKVIFKKTDFVNSKNINPVYEYSKLINEIIFDKKRNDMIVDDIYNEVLNNETCLVLSDRKMHCENLFVLLEQKYNIESCLLTGDVLSTQRDLIINKMNNGECKVLIATGQLIGEGFDCENLSCLFITTPLKYGGRLLQYIGRILRTSETKENALIYDYVDSKIKTLKKSADNRKKLYKKEYITITGEY